MSLGDCIPAERKYDNVAIDIAGAVAKVSLNRPHVMNAINKDMLTELRDVFSSMRFRDDIHVVILTGRGKAFCSGRDLKEYRKYNSTPLQEWELRQSGEAGFNFLLSFEKPIIAAINGAALAGGCELALSCDIRIASEEARFGFPEINFGIFPGAGATYLLPRIIGKSRALKLILMGDFIDAYEAERIGLVDQVVPASQLEATAFELANRIAKKSLKAVKLAKAAVDMCAELSVIQGMRMTAALRSLAETPDVMASLESWLARERSRNSSL